MKATDVSWLKGEVENHRLKHPVDEARKTLHKHKLTDEDITVLWREFRKLLLKWVYTRLDDPRNIPPQMATHAFQGEFSPLHSKYTDHELFIGALSNKYTPLMEFGKKHKHEKILSICILKEALHGNPDAALHAAQMMEGASNTKKHQKRQTTNRANAGGPKKLNSWMIPFRNEVKTLKQEGFNGAFVPEIYKRLKEYADGNDGAYQGKQLPTKATFYGWYKNM